MPRIFRFINEVGTIDLTHFNNFISYISSRRFRERTHKQYIIYRAMEAIEKAYIDIGKTGKENEK